MKSLNTPVKRVGFIILLLGGLLSVIAAFQIYNHHYDSRHFFTTWLDSVLFQRNYTRRYPLAAYGTWLTFLGLLFSYFYDSTLKRLFMWISSGSHPAKGPAKSTPLHFKDAKSALEYSCKYMQTDLMPDQITPCLVVSTSKSNQAESFAVIDIPTDDGPKRTVAAFLNDVVPSDIVGRLCAAYVGPADPSSGVTPFLICGELSLTWHDGAWEMKRRF